MTRLANLAPAPARPCALTRAAVTAAVAAAKRSDPDTVAANLFSGDDRRIGQVLRAATGPHTLAGDPALSQTVSAFVLGLGPISAAAALLARGLHLDLAARSAIPAIAPGGAQFVAEGMPIPVTALAASAPALEPRKIIGMAVISNTLARGSNAEPLIADALGRSSASELDRVLFGSAAASAAAPAGLLHGITPMPSSGDLLTDLAELADAVGPIGSASFVASPGAALRINAALGVGAALGSASVAPGTVIAVVGEAIAWGADPEPDIAVDGRGAVHMTDQPGEIVSDAGATADPVRSLFQTDATAVRISVDIAWVLRAPGAVALKVGVVV